MTISYRSIVNSPIKWVGGKSRLRKVIVPMLPQHSCYVEVFGGAGWVLLAKPPSDVEIFNDLDGELVNFFQVVKKKPTKLIQSFEWELVSRGQFNKLAKADTSKMSDLQRAHRFYYLIMAGWGGEFGYPRFQTSVTDKGHGNRLVSGLKYIKERIFPVYQRLQNVLIEQLDWRECIARYDRKYSESRVVMYLDPPYPNNNCNYLHNMRDWSAHEELYKQLRKMRCRFLLTSYDLPETRALYKHFYITPVSFAAGMPSSDSRSQNREIIVTNFKPKSTNTRTV